MIGEELAGVLKELAALRKIVQQSTKKTKRRGRPNMNLIEKIGSGGQTGDDRVGLTSPSNTGFLMAVGALPSE